MLVKGEVEHSRGRIEMVCGGREGKPDHTSQVSFLVLTLLL